MVDARLVDKPFDIPKQLVWDAYLKVQANKGAAGVDRQSLADFAQDERNNLYRIWNRMASGSYFPAPVRAVKIPKPGGGIRILGVPTITDRIAQTVVAMVLEPEVEKIFSPDSYGYRPGRSALDAVGVARQRCWKRNWVLDMDIQGFFDNVPHEPILKAVAHHHPTGMDPVVCRALADRTNSTTRRKLGCSRSRHPARVGDLPIVVEPVHALCI